MTANKEHNPATLPSGPSLSDPSCALETLKRGGPDAQRRCRACRPAISNRKKWVAR